MTDGGSWAPVPGKIPGTELNLGGRVLVLAPLNLDQVQAFDEKISGLGGDVPLRDAINAAVPIIHASLSRNYPDMTVDDVRGLLDVGNFRQALEAVVASSGYALAVPGESSPASR